MTYDECRLLKEALQDHMILWKMAERDLNTMEGETGERCIGITESGRRCRRGGFPMSGGARCHSHGGIRQPTFEDEAWLVSEIRSSEARVRAAIDQVMAGVST